MDHKERALSIIASTEHIVEPPNVNTRLLEAQVHAILHLAETVQGVAVELDYIDQKLQRQ